MSTSFVLLAQNFNANNVDVMGFELYFSSSTYVVLKFQKTELNSVISPIICP